MISRTTRITIETERFFLVRQGRTVVTWCPQCQAEVEVMQLSDPAAAAPFLGGLGAATVHVWTVCGGPTQLCFPSLLRQGQPDDIQSIAIPERMLPKEGEGQ